MLSRRNTELKPLFQHKNYGKFIVVDLEDKDSVWMNVNYLHRLDRTREESGLYANFELWNKNIDVNIKSKKFGDFIMINKKERDTISSIFFDKPSIPYKQLEDDTIKVEIIPILV